MTGALAAKGIDKELTFNSNILTQPKMKE